VTATQLHQCKKWGYLLTGLGKEERREGRKSEEKRRLEGVLQVSDNCMYESRRE
jgi:hypothetical protein